MTHPDQLAVRSILDQYYAAFSTLDVQAILPFFHEPAVVVGPQGVYAALTHSDLTAAFSLTMEGLRARGYGRSELSPREVKLLSPSTALVIGVAIRYKTDGNELERAGVTYVMQKAD